MKNNFQEYNIQAKDKKLNLAFYVNIPIIIKDNKLFSKFSNLLDFLNTFTDAAEVQLITPMKRFSEDKDKLPAFKIINNFSALYPLPYYERPFENIKNILSLVNRLNKTIKNIIDRSDYLIITGPSVTASLILINLLKKKNVNLIIFIRGDKKVTVKYHLNGIKRILMYLLTKLNYRFKHYTLANKKLKGVIGIGKFCIMEFSQYKCLVIHPMVDNYFLEKKKVLRHFQRPLIFGYIGRFDKEKNIDDILELFLSLRNHEDRLILVGSGSLELNLRKAIKEKHMKFIDILPPYSCKHECLTYLDKIDIFIHLARTGSGRAVWEAMARGCVSIISPGGIDEGLINGISCIYANSGIHNIRKILEDSLELQIISDNARKASEKMTFRNACKDVLTFLENNHN